MYIFNSIFVNNKVKIMAENKDWNGNYNSLYKTLGASNHTNKERQNMEKNVNNMPTPMELFGVECRKGWYELIIPIAEYIENYNKEHPENEYPMCFTQIKEKWGGLRVYVNYGTKELFDMIEKAEDESYQVCETCGSREDVGLKFDGWYETMCHKCAVERAMKNSQFLKFERISDGQIVMINPDGSEEDLKDTL